jgi:hypothetical protein
MNDSKDYLDEMIEESCKDPIFDRIWASSEAVHQLVELRVKLGLTQEDVAKTMKVKRPRVSEIEAHPENVSFSRLSLYASAQPFQSKSPKLARFLWSPKSARADRWEPPEGGTPSQPEH